MPINHQDNAEINSKARPVSIFEEVMIKEIIPMIDAQSFERLPTGITGQLQAFRWGPIKPCGLS